MNWQPIETAPKDGTKVLVWRRHDLCNTAWWKWNVFNTKQEWGGTGWSYPEWDQPTHWQPLPDPPSDLQRGEST